MQRKRKALAQHGKEQFDGCMSCPQCAEDWTVKGKNGMRIIDIIKKIVHKEGTAPEKAAMDYCFAHGFTAGKNFQYNSGSPIDANCHG